jgi:3'-phosphoadenosine 5'-phosphosulfate sulfotransferase (PAPS reductase)/FAD synthetase
MRIIFTSCGNDSIALTQWAKENAKDKRVIVAYSDTGWAADFWEARVCAVESWVNSIGFEFVRIKSIGFREACLKNGGFPRSDMQFCTRILKREPANKWMDVVDPEKEAICTIGIRREESANRANFPEFTNESPNHGGRDLHAPLVRYTEAMRNELLSKTPFHPMAVRSKECYPCVHARAQEIALLPDKEVIKVRILENAVSEKRGRTSTMFRPEKHGGAVGIDAVMEHRKKTGDMFGDGFSCDGGWCGS